MTEVSRIVFPTDFSELSNSAWPWATRLAAVLDAEIHCIYVVEIPVVYGTLGLEPMPAPSLEELGENAEKMMGQFIEKHGSGQQTVAKVLTGRAADSIVEYADEIDAGMIVISTHGYSGLKHIVLGSTTEAVLRHAQCPVLSIPQR